MSFVRILIVPGKQKYNWKLKVQKFPKSKSCDTCNIIFVYIYISCVGNMGGGRVHSQFCEPIICQNFEYPGEQRRCSAKFLTLQIKKIGRQRLCRRMYNMRYKYVAFIDKFYPNQGFDKQKPTSCTYMLPLAFVWRRRSVVSSLHSWHFLPWWLVRCRHVLQYPAGYPTIHRREHPRECPMPLLLQVCVLSENWNLIMISSTSLSHLSFCFLPSLSDQLCMVNNSILWRVFFRL